MKYKILKNSFLGSPLDSSKNYIVGGAGIAGLLCAYHLKKRGIKVEVHEKSARAGGLLGSKKLENGICEQAANGFLWSPELAAICKDLGIEMIGPKPSAKSRYLIRNNKLRKFPLGIFEAAGMIRRLFISRGQKIETVKDFGELYLGPTATQQVLAPAMAGIYGAELDKLSFPGVLPFVAEHIHKRNRLPFALLSGFYVNEKMNPTPKKEKKPSGTHSFKGGMQEFIDALAAHLKNEIHYNSDALELKNENRQLVLSMPAFAAAKAFPEHHAINGMLKRVAYTSLISMTCIFHKKDLPKLKPGFGCLVPPSEGLNTMGILFNSHIFKGRAFDDRKHISLTCIIGDRKNGQNILEEEEAVVVTRTMKELQKLFGLEVLPIEYSMFRWPKAIPIYSPELYRNWFLMDEYLKKDFPNINIFGNYSGNISIRKMAGVFSLI